MNSHGAFLVRRQRITRLHTFLCRVRPMPESACPVCLTRPYGYHFNGLSCRACAEFYRRCIKFNRTTGCRISLHQLTGISCMEKHFSGAPLQEMPLSALRLKWIGTSKFTNEVPHNLFTDSSMKPRPAMKKKGTPVETQDPRILSTPSESIILDIPETALKSNQTPDDRAPISTQKQRTNIGALLLPHIKQKCFVVFEPCNAESLG